MLERDAVGEFVDCGNGKNHGENQRDRIQTEETSNRNVEIIPVQNRDIDGYDERDTDDSDKAAGKAKANFLLEPGDKGVRIKCLELYRENAIQQLTPRLVQLLQLCPGYGIIEQQEACEFFNQCFN